MPLKSFEIQRPQRPDGTVMQEEKYVDFLDQWRLDIKIFEITGALDIDFERAVILW